MFSQDSIGGYLIAEERFMQVTIRNIVIAYGEEHDLKAIHLYVLGMFSSSEGITIKQLREKTHMTSSNLSPICNVLENRTLIRRERNKADGRSSYLFLTEQGTEMLQGLDRLLDKILSSAGSNNRALRDDIRRGFQAFRTLVAAAREQESKHD